MIKDERLLLKKKFLEYFRELPIQKLAGAFIARSEDTITDWKREDSDFSDQVDQAKADWAMARTQKVKSEEWLLERVMKDHFSPRNEMTGKDGEKLDPLIVIKDK